MGIHILPHITNALLVTSIFSAGNTYTYCATRSLYGLALEGRAPGFLRYCTKSGVPVACFAVTICFGFLSFLEVGSGSAKVLGWLINLITAGGIIDFIIMVITYIFFYRACKAQNFDRKALPYYGWYQPFCAYFSLGWLCLVCLTYGYTSFTPWDVGTFFSYYAMVILAPVLFIAWKLIKRTKVIKPLEADLIWEAPIIDAYEADFLNAPAGFWTEMVQMFGFKKEATKERRKSSVAVAHGHSIFTHHK